MTKDVVVTFNKPYDVDWDFPCVLWPQFVRMPVAGESITLNNDEDYIIKSVNWTLEEDGSVSVEMVCV